MFNKLVKYDFILRYEAWVNAIKASSFIENFPKISTKPIAFQRNLLGKLSRNRPFFTNRFSAKLASKIPATFPRNRPFFPRICPWKSREIWLFFPRPTRSPVFDCNNFKYITVLFAFSKSWRYKQLSEIGQHQIQSPIWTRGNKFLTLEKLCKHS